MIVGHAKNGGDLSKSEVCLIVMQHGWKPHLFSRQEDGCVSWYNISCLLSKAVYAGGCLFQVIKSE